MLNNRFLILFFFKFYFYFIRTIMLNKSENLTWSLNVNVLHKHSFSCSFSFSSYTVRMKTDVIYIKTDGMACEWKMSIRVASRCGQPLVRSLLRLNIQRTGEMGWAGTYGRAYRWKTKYEKWIIYPPSQSASQHQHHHGCSRTRRNK